MRKFYFYSMNTEKLIQDFIVAEYIRTHEKKAQIYTFVLFKILYKEFPRLPVIAV